jgi:hypothetical protein
VIAELDVAFGLGEGVVWVQPSAVALSAGLCGIYYTIRSARVSRGNWRLARRIWAVLAAHEAYATNANSSKKRSLGA